MIREGLPLKLERWNQYLSWAVDAFRLATAIAQPQTQVHTHCATASLATSSKRLNVWILKTRRWEEVIPALKNMVTAAQQVREEAHATKE